MGITGGWRCIFLRLSAKEFETNACLTRLRQISSIRIIFDNIIKDDAIMLVPSSSP
jgi:hypothetical protein